MDEGAFHRWARGTPCAASAIASMIGARTPSIADGHGKGGL